MNGSESAEDWRDGHATVQMDLDGSGPVDAWLLRNIVVPLYRDGGIYELCYMRVFAYPLPGLEKNFAPLGEPTPPKFTQLSLFLHNTYTKLHPMSEQQPYQHQHQHKYSGEKWKPINSSYSVSSHGRLRSYKGRQPRILRQSPMNQSGDYGTVIMIDGKRKVIYTYREVARAFLKRDLTRKDRVRHIDGDKTNNRVENLEIA